MTPFPSVMTPFPSRLSPVPREVHRPSIHPFEPRVVWRGLGALPREITSDRGPLTPEDPPLLALSGVVTHPLDRTADALGDVLERLVLVRPCRHGPQVNRESLEPEERGTHPVNRTEQDRDHRRLAFVMAIKSPLGFNVVAVIRGEKRRTDQKQDDLGFFQVLVELTLPLLACPDSSVMPTYDIALPLQESQMLLKLVSQSLILVRVSVEQADRSGWLLGGCGLRRSSPRTTWSVWSDRGTISRRFGTRNRLCQPKSLLAFGGGDVGAEPISQANSLDEPLGFESVQPVPHVLNEHLGCDSEAGVVHVPG